MKNQLGARGGVLCILWVLFCVAGPLVVVLSRRWEVALRQWSRSQPWWPVVPNETNPPGANARLLTYCLTATSPIHTHASFLSIDDRPKHSSTWPPCVRLLIWGWSDNRATTRRPKIVFCLRGPQSSANQTVISVSCLHRFHQFSLGRRDTVWETGTTLISSCRMPPSC